jgi:hypothetical protein
MRQSSHTWPTPPCRCQNHRHLLQSLPVLALPPTSAAGGRPTPACSCRAGAACAGHAAMQAVERLRASSSGPVRERGSDLQIGNHQGMTVAPQLIAETEVNFNRVFSSWSTQLLSTGTGRARRPWQALSAMRTLILSTLLPRMLACTLHAPRLRREIARCGAAVGARAVIAWPPKPRRGSIARPRAVLKRFTSAVSCHLSATCMASN